MKEGKFSISNKKQTCVMAAAAVLGLLIFSLLVWMVRADRQETRRTILDISDIYLAEMADQMAGHFDTTMNSQLSDQQHYGEHNGGGSGKHGNAARLLSGTGL